MALLRAPSQFAPGQSGGPVTPSCCGCCCCCCCAGTVAATSIALPMLLHQFTRPGSVAEDDAASDDAAPPQSQPPQTSPPQSQAPQSQPMQPPPPQPPMQSPPMQPPPMQPPPMQPPPMQPPPMQPAQHPSQRSDDGAPSGRRSLGILLAALGVPAGIAVFAAVTALAGQVVSESAPIGLAVGVLALIGLPIAGYRIGGVRDIGRTLVPVLVLLVATVAFLLEVVLWASMILGDSSQQLLGLGALIVLAIPTLTVVLIMLWGRRRSRRRPAVP